MKTRWIFTGVCWHGTGPVIGDAREAPTKFTIETTRPPYAVVIGMTCPICKHEILLRDVDDRESRGVAS